MYKIIYISISISEKNYFVLQLVLILGDKY